MGIGFLIKKALSIVISPMGLTLLAALAALYLWRKGERRAKYYLLAALVIPLFFAYQPVANALVTPLESSFPTLAKTPQNARYVMVLGSGHKDALNLPITSLIYPVGVVRLNEGMRHCHAMQTCTMIVSGYRGMHSNVTHAKRAEQFLTSMGIERIIRLDAPKDTFEEAVEAKKIVKNEPFILVTSASHMPRAIRFFHQAGLNPIAAPTYHRMGKTRWMLPPNGYHLYSSEMAIHEYIGQLWQRIKGWI